ncbi:hypothetical protein, partial [Burkholderia orbicola]
MLVPRLFVFVVTELRPVDSEPMELVADERPVDVEVDSDVIELLADDSPVEADVESEVTELLVELSPVDSE